jgi:Ca2+:H+ antiporter
VIAIILAIFLLTYTYIEARSNYHRGSTLVLSYVPNPLLLRILMSRYLVLVMGFYFAPDRGQGDIEVNPDGALPTLGQTLTRLWA